MGNTHDTEMARIEADFIGTRWRTTEDYRWGYTKDRGPETWWVYYPSASGGNQSPVDIATEDVHIDHDLTANPLQICYNPGPKEVKMLSNTGNTARVNIVNSRSSINGGPCKENSYVLEQFHLHWGETDAAGSEHLINSRPHSAELHLVHWNEDLYDSYEEAIRRDDGIAIIAVFVKVAESNCNKGLLLLSKLIDDVVYRDQTVRITEELEVKSLLPDDVTKYWTYHGSFTTPPCYETVTWIILVQPITVTSEVLNKFRKLRSYCETDVRPTDEYDGQILSNDRPLQPLGTRKISTVETSLHRRRPKSYDRQIQEQTTVRVSIFPELFDPQRRQELFQWLQ